MTTADCCPACEGGAHHIQHYPAGSALLRADPESDSKPSPRPLPPLPPLPHMLSAAQIAGMRDCNATILDCQRVARVTGAPAHVISNGNLYWLAGDDDLPVYWLGLIGSGHARIIYSAWPRVGAFGDPPTDDPTPMPPPWERMEVAA